MGMTKRLRRTMRLRISSSKSITATTIRTRPTTRTSIPPMMPTATGIRKLVGLLHLASPALPIGGVSYSQGLEGAVECRLVHDGENAREWMRNGLEIILAAKELPG